MLDLVLLHGALQRHDALVGAGHGALHGDEVQVGVHSRYDIEKPHIRRFIRRKLEVINRQKSEIAELKEEIKQKNELLKRLAAEYTILGRECEHEHMNEAAIRNYEKALELYPDAGDARRRLKKLQKQ